MYNIETMHENSAKNEDKTGDEIQNEKQRKNEHNVITDNVETIKMDIIQSLI